MKLKTNELYFGEGCTSATFSPYHKGANCVSVELKKRAEEQGLVLYVIELLSSWASVDTRRMFGGTGLFMGGRMFGIFFDDVLYLKDFVEVKDSPELSEKEYLGYERNDKFVNLGYFKAPERSLEDGRYLIELAKQSYQSACAKKVKAKPKRKLKEPPSMPAPF